MKRLLVMMAAVAGLLAGCAREGRDVTGSYGGGMLAGTVVLSGIEGSPEGVEVSVRDTGMTATLGADGRFAFAGVPGNAILDFRRGDGIQASLAVSGNSNGSSVLVQLGRGSASKSGRGNSGKDKRERPELREYEGTIVRASATELVVFTSKKVEVTFLLNADTVIRKGNTPVAPEELRPGQRVHVKGLAAGDGPVTAVQVTLQNTRDNETVTVSGDVTGLSGGNLTVATRDGQWTVQTNAATRFKKQGKAIGLADVAAGDKVTAKGRRVSENTILASEVEVRGKSGRP